MHINQDRKQLNMDEILEDNGDNWYSDTEKALHLKAWERSNTETLLRSWGEKSGGLRWMHIKSAYIWRRLDTRLNYCGIILSSITSATSMMGAMESLFPKEYLMMFVGFVGMLNIISQSFIKFYNSSEKAALHDTAARQFGNFNRYIATKLSMSRIDRGPPHEILNYALKENDRLYNENPDPHPRCIILFKDFIKNTDFLESKVEFAVPDIINCSFRVGLYDERLSYCDLENGKKNEQQNFSEYQFQTVKRLNEYIKNKSRKESSDLMRSVYDNTPTTPIYTIPQSDQSKRKVSFGDNIINKEIKNSYTNDVSATL